MDDEIRVSVEVGQVWQDWDSRWRKLGIQRKITVLSVGQTHAYCLSDRGRYVAIRLNRFRENSTGYKLVEASRGK